MKLEQFKKGGKVRRFQNGNNGGLNQGEVGTMVEIVGSDISVKTKSGQVGSHDPENLELVTNNINDMSILKKFALTFKQEPEKSFIKAGITDGDDVMTEEGEQVFMCWLLKKYGNDFKKEVVDPILSNEEKETK